MADLAELDLKARGGEFRLRALLEDLIDYHKRVYPAQKLALVVWFTKSANNNEHNLLELFTPNPMTKIAVSQRQSLLWKTGSDEPPFVNLHATSVDYFRTQLASNPESLARFFENSEVLYFDKRLLPEDILRAFKVVTEPTGHTRGWYISDDLYRAVTESRYSLISRQQSAPEIGLVKTEESPDFEHCRGVLHVEVSQRWVPISLEALRNFAFYNELQEGHPGYFFFEGGALYKILKFEVKTAPDYSERVLEKLPHDRYPEVYLRAVHPPEQSAA